MSHEIIDSDKIIYSAKGTIMAVMPYFILSAAVIAVLSALDFFAAGIAAAAIISLVRIVAVRRNGVVITESKLVLGGGFFQSESTCILYSEVEDVQWYKSLSGAIFGYGRITVSFGDRKCHVKYIKKPDYVAAEILRQADIYNFKRTCIQAESAKVDMKSKGSHKG